MPLGAEFRLCGPAAFVAQITADLLAGGVAAQRIRSESFGGAPSRTPAAPGTADGPSVCFERSGVTTCWDSGFASLLDLAEASAVAAPSGCRMGSCHGCAAGVISGVVRHDPEPLAPPAAGSALLCCALPVGDVVLDA